MTYEQATQHLFDSAPLFQNIGAAAYKEGLEGTLVLDAYFGHPHRNYHTIHVGGTNGKGSVCHTLAAILQSQGYRVGLYTSPHLVDFRERIRVNGKKISKHRVIEFVKEIKDQLSTLSFSFFELATSLAFQYFSEQKVDFAIIEVGLGGRLDCTNIIKPILSIITNISFDHVQLLGDTLPKIASEKAGIIKPGVPVCIGENVNPEVKAVFADKAKEVDAPITFAEDLEIESLNLKMDRALTGLCQEKNTRTIWASIHILREQGIDINNESVKRGFREVTTMTGLMGRWQTISNNPTTICDTGHNVGGMQYITKQLQETPYKKLHIIIGMVGDKDVNTVLSMLPKDAIYYFTQASVKRAMPVKDFSQAAQKHQIYGSCYENVESAYRAAKQNADTDDLIFIGGSTFVVADMFKSMF